MARAPSRRELNPWAVKPFLVSRALSVRYAATYSRESGGPLERGNPMMFWLIVAVVLIAGFAGAWWMSGRSKGDASSGISGRATRTQSDNISNPNSGISGTGVGGGGG